MSDVIKFHSEEDEAEPKHRNLLLRFFTNRIVYDLHLFFYGSVNGLLIMIWLVSWSVAGLTYFWPFHTLFGWGFVLGFHALTYTMYNDKSEYLAEVRSQSPYIMTFVYHAFFYTSINLYLFLINLIDLTFMWFTWSLGMWGIAFGYHTVGYFTWNKIFNAQWKNLRPLRPEYSKKRLKHIIIVKIGNFWILLIHMTYFIVTYVIVNVYVFVGTGLGIVALYIIAEIFVPWGVFLIWHALSFIFYYYVKAIKDVVKNLILHITFVVVLNGLMILEILAFSRYEVLFPWEAVIYFALLSAIGIAIHTIITAKWEYFIEDAKTKVTIKYGQKLEDDDVRSIAKQILFWRWSLVTHFLIYIVSLIIIAVNLIDRGIDLFVLIHPAMGWLVGVVFHGAVYIIVYKPIKGFWAYSAFLHLIVYIIVCIYLVILNLLFVPDVPWSLYSILGWGIGVGIHLLIMYSTRKRKTIERRKKSIREMFWLWTFIIHFFIYVVCLIIIGMSLVIGGQDLLILIHPAMGWLIGIAFHGSIYIIVKKPIKGFLSYTAFLHFVVYVVISAYLVILNVIFDPGIAWSAIAITGWGIGFGFHVLLAYLKKK